MRNILNNTKKEEITLDLFKSETDFNFIVFGSSGSGKSYTMLDFCYNYMLEGAKIRVIDIGRSYEKLNKLVKGNYVELKKNSNICLNFFTNMKTNEGEFDFTCLPTIIPVIELMITRDNENKNLLLETTIQTALEKSIKEAFLKKGKLAGMKDVLIELEIIEKSEKEEKRKALLKRLIKSIIPFGKESGEFYNYFNGKNNLELDNPFTIFELEDFFNDEWLTALLTGALSQQINNEFSLDKKEQKKILLIDEAWSFLENKSICNLFINIARNSRQKNISLGIIAQKIQDSTKNKSGLILLESIGTKIFFKQIENSFESNPLNISKKNIDSIDGLKKKMPISSDFFIIKDNGKSFFATLEQDRFLHWIFTESFEDLKIIHSLMEELNFEEFKIRIIKGLSEKYSISIKEAIEKELKLI